MWLINRVLAGESRELSGLFCAGQRRRRCGDLFCCEDSNESGGGRRSQQPLQLRHQTHLVLRDKETSEDIRSFCSCCETFCLCLALSRVPGCIHSSSQFGPDDVMVMVHLLRLTLPQPASLGLKSGLEVGETKKNACVIIMSHYFTIQMSLFHN